MDPTTIIEWFIRQSYKVIKTNSSYWVEVIPHIAQSFPYHWLIKPDVYEIKSLWFDHGIYGIRFSQPICNSSGKISYHVVSPLEDERYTLDGVHKKPRYDIRKGLKNFDIHPITMEQFRIDGWPVRLETLTRQRRTGAETKEWWERMCISAEGLPGFEAWAAYSGNLMAASALVIQCEDYSYIYYQQSRTDSLRLGVNNSLAFSITTEMLSREGIRRVFYGLQSLDARISVDRFKFRMGFEAKPVRQTVLFHPYITPIINQFSHYIVQSLSTLKPGSILSKAEGMFRFYLEGKKNIEEQDWPDVLLVNPDSHLITHKLESVSDGKI